MIAAVLLHLTAMAEMPDEFVEQVRPVLEANCVECHGGDEPEADLDLSRFRTRAEALEAPEVFARVRERVEADEMPPPIVGALSTDEADRLLDWVEANFAPETRHDPDPVHLRRLNRAEYRNTVLDLFGVALATEELFPPESVGHGFDTSAGVQSLSPALFEAFFDTAERVADLVVTNPGRHRPARITRSAAKLEASSTIGLHEGFRVLSTNARVIARIAVQRTGEYRLRVVATAQQAGGEPARMRVSLDGKALEQFKVENVAPAPETFELELTLLKGEHTFAAAFINDYFAPEAADPMDRDRNLWVREIEVVGPLGTPGPTAFQKQLEERYPAAREALHALARLTWRRPAADVEIERLLALSAVGEDWDHRVRSALVALLASPNFLLRGEGLYGSDWALASQLSFLLWSSTPDERLLDLAEAGRLEERLEDELRRMLRDPRASALARRFAPQWLQLERLDEHAPDPRRFPEVDAQLLLDMRRESELFFEAILREDRPVSELLDADFTFVNAALAKHYGMPGVQGTHLRRIRVPDALRGQRGGLLGQAGILTATSNPTRTSPVLRGKWLLEVVLGTPPPPPPPGVGALAAASATGHELTLRERLERHRTDASCTVCHAPMDALGFGLENYDAVGAWRDSDGGSALDTRGALTDGTEFNGPAALRVQLAGNTALSCALATSLAIYGLGRGLEREEKSELVTRVQALDSPTLSQLLLAVVTSAAFTSPLGTVATSGAGATR